jgi:hypothetical protein
VQKFDIFQQNNLKVGTHLAAEISPTSPEVYACVVIGSYIQTPFGRKRPSKTLNKEQSDLRFWFHKYEVNKYHLEVSDDISEKQLINAVKVDNILTIEQLEYELRRYLQDFSLLQAAWKFDPPLPFF